MSAEQNDRIARLTELARKVPAWSGVRKCYGMFVLVEEPGTAAVFSGDEDGEEDEISPLLDACGDVDALERALVALAGEPTPADLALHDLVSALSTVALEFQHEAAFGFADAETEEECAKLRAVCQRHADAVHRELVRVRAGEPPASPAEPVLKRLEHAYCIEGDYTGEEHPVALRMQAMNRDLARIPEMALELQRLRDGIEALLTKHRREVGDDPDRVARRELVPVPHHELRELLGGGT